MKISNGCTDSTLDLSNSVFTDQSDTPLNTSNTNAPTSKVCHLFSPEGGGMSPVVPSAASLDMEVASPLTWKRGHTGLRAYQIPGLGTDGTASLDSVKELIVMTPYINKETCAAVNDMAGIDNPSGQPPSITNTGSGGLYTNGQFVGSTIFTDALVVGKPFFCRYISSQSIYQYVHAIIER